MHFSELSGPGIVINISLQIEMSIYCNKPSRLTSSYRHHRGKMMMKHRVVSCPSGQEHQTQAEGPMALVTVSKE